MPPTVGRRGRCWRIFRWPMTLGARVPRRRRCRPGWQPDPAEAQPAIRRSGATRCCRAGETESVLGRQPAHWREVLAGLPEELPLPRDRARDGERQSREGPPPVGQISLEVPAPLVTELSELAARMGASLYMVLLAGLAGLYRRRAGEDIPLGVPLPGVRRPRSIVGGALRSYRRPSDGRLGHPRACRVGTARPPGLSGRPDPSGPALRADCRRTGPAAPRRAASAVPDHAGAAQPAAARADA